MDFTAFKKEIQTHFTCLRAKPAIKQMGGKKIKDFQTEAPLINQTKLTAELSNSFCSFTSRGERERETLLEHRSITLRIHWGHVKLMSYQNCNWSCIQMHLAVNVPSLPWLVKWTLSCLRTCNKHAQHAHTAPCSYSSPVWFVMG